MTQKINEFRQILLKCKNFTVVYGDSGLDLSELIFKDFTKNVLSYQVDDKYYSGHTKLLSFFDVHNAATAYSSILLTIMQPID